MRAVWRYRCPCRSWFPRQSGRVDRCTRENIPGKYARWLWTTNHSPAATSPCCCGMIQRIEIVSECGSGMDALTEIRKSRPDLVFLDVQMPECDGFDVLEMLGGDLPPAVVFVTAYDLYALRAFESGALDYLLKPFDNDRFERALSRARERVVQAGNSPRKKEQIVVKSAGELTFLKLSEIDWIEAADYYSCLHVGGKSHLLRRSMADLDDELDQ